MLGAFVYALALRGLRVLNVHMARTNAIATRHSSRNHKSTTPTQESLNACQKTSPTNKPMPDMHAPTTGPQ